LTEASEGGPRRLFEDRRRALSFGDAPELYDRTRPSYPAALVERLLADGAAEVLDVGCGTGIVSRLFRARGCAVVGVEPDARMADFARAQGLTVEAGTLEDWDSGGRRFDLVVAGQAWHWVDPHAGAAKALSLLRPGGRIGLFWNWARHPEDVQGAFEAVYARLAPELDRHSIVLGRGRDERFSVAEAGLSGAGFRGVSREEFVWSTTYSREHWHDSLLTHSDHHTLDAGQREALLAAVDEAVDAMGGSFTTNYRTVLVTALSPNA
jgi:SAM-dependent methyltransferase